MLKRILFPVLLSMAVAPSVLGQSGNDSSASSSPEVFSDGIDLSASGLPDTIMFTIDERNEILTRQQAGDVSGNAYRASAIEDANLYLSSIIYFDQKEWLMWINGVQITPDFQVDTFEVVSIQPDYVELIVPLSAAGVRPVRLEPNQTFIGETGVVVEGAFN